MSATTTTVYILLDGFRWDYINEVDTPYLYGLAEKGVYARQLISSTGFTQRTAMFTGANPDTSGSFTFLYYSPDTSPYEFLRPYSAALDWIEGAVGHLPLPLRSRWQWRVRQGMIRRIAARRAAYPIVGNVPFRILQNLALAEDGRLYLHDPGASATETLFDVLHERGLAAANLMYPIASGAGPIVLDAATRHLGLNADLYTFQFNDSDTKVHVLGSEGIARRNIVHSMDADVKTLMGMFAEKYEDVNYLIIGDHGMMDVDQKVDVQEMFYSFASGKGLRHYKDYLLFADSTMIRVWFLRDSAAKAFGDITELDTLQTLGRFLTPDLCRQLRIPAPGKQYGDLIWWANPGVLVHPCYWHGRTEDIKSMHGYDSYHEKMRGFAILSSAHVRPKLIPEVHLIDICATLCDLLGVRYPTSNEGVSLMKRA